MCQLPRKIPADYNKKIGGFALLRKWSFCGKTGRGRRQRKVPTIYLQFILCNRKFKGATNSAWSSGDGVETSWRARKLFRLEHHLVAGVWETIFWRWGKIIQFGERCQKKNWLKNKHGGITKGSLYQGAVESGVRMRKLQLRKWGNYSSARKWRIMTAAFSQKRHTAPMIHYSDPCSMSAPTKHNQIQITANFSPFCPSQNKGHYQGFEHLHTFWRYLETGGWTKCKI